MTPVPAPTGERQAPRRGEALARGTLIDCEQREHAMKLAMMGLVRMVASIAAEMR
jgi:hypothetical protein